MEHFILSFQSKEHLLSFASFYGQIRQLNVRSDGPNLQKVNAAKIETALLPKFVEFEVDLHTLSTTAGLYWTSNMPRRVYWQDDDKSIQERYMKMILKDPNSGITCQAFSPELWRGRVMPFEVWRINIKPGFKIFNCHNSSHKDQLAAWMNDEENAKKENRWDSLSCRDKSMTQKFKEENCNCAPSHFAFYKENKFGACLRVTESGTFIQIIDEECIDGDWVLEKTVTTFHFD